ncbi:hypothetical protein FGO68_gene1679 [Halteria grandinella]|uniref:Uncharacterized protein n=1 Tax=Halteria grandinella TaxID=5974 RepID=A0A8J8N9F4_HALGN|nr:hypothetical protein FGO68_gene1679 [Halteria grandinella]
MNIVQQLSEANYVDFIHHIINIQQIKKINCFPMNDQTPIKEVDLNKQSWTSPKDKSDRFIPRNVQQNLYQLFMSEENHQGNLYNNLLQSSILGTGIQVKDKKKYFHRQLVINLLLSYKNYLTIKLRTNKMKLKILIPFSIMA